MRVGRIGKRRWSRRRRRRRRKLRRRRWRLRCHHHLRWRRHYRRRTRTTRKPSGKRACSALETRMKAAIAKPPEKVWTMQPKRDNNRNTVSSDDILVGLFSKKEAAHRIADG